MKLCDARPINLLYIRSGSSPNVIALRDAELNAKTLQIEHLKAQLAVLRRTSEHRLPSPAAAA